MNTLNNNDFTTPRMSAAELELFRQSIPRGGRVLEFGAGGSTSYFFAQGAASLVSVESDRAFLEHLYASPVLQGKNWLPIHAAIGETGAWGYPIEERPQADWLNYHTYCWALMPNKHFDFILIDGRFRVACFFQSLLHCTNDSALILIHDFWIRPQYHIILDFCDVLERAESSVLLRRKTEISWRNLAVLLQEYQFAAD